MGLRDELAKLSPRLLKGEKKANARADEIEGGIRALIRQNNLLNNQRVEGEASLAQLQQDLAPFQQQEAREAERQQGLRLEADLRSAEAGWTQAKSRALEHSRLRDAAFKRLGEYRRLISERELHERSMRVQQRPIGG